MKSIQKLLFVILIMTVVFSLGAQEHNGKIIVQFKSDNSNLSTLSTRSVATLFPGIKVKKIERLISDERIEKLHKRIEKAQSKKVNKVRDLTDEKALNKLFLIEPDETQHFEDVLSSLKNDKRVLYAEPDYIVHALNTPNDTHYSKLWGMNKIEAPKAWDIQTDSTTVIVAVIDTGVDYNHPDLKEFCISGYDYFDNDSDPMDSGSHGTHCAGTVGAKGNNSLGVAGATWNVKIMPVRFLGPGGGNTSDAIKSVDYAVTHDADVLSNSWGGGGYNQGLYDAIKRARDAGVIFVAAAGNSGTNNDSSPHYPSSYNLDNVVAVANTTSSDGINSGSCYGKTSVDLGAPGTDIYSTVPGNSYAYKTGTSMATPHVSGVAALLKSINPDWGYKEIKDCLMNTATPLTALSGKCVSGARLNAYKAVQQANEYRAQKLSLILHDVIFNDN